MRRRVSVALAVTALAAAFAMTVFSLASLVLPGVEILPDRPSLMVVAAASSVFLSFPLVGALVAVRRPENPIGWLFLVIGLSLTAGLFATEYVWRAVLLDAPLPGAGIVAWIGAWGFYLGIGLAFTWLPLLFPTGRVVGRWRRILFGVSTAVIALGVWAIALRPDALDDYGGRVEPPIALPETLAGPLAAVEALYFPTILILGLLSVGSVVARFRGAGAIERQQLKWFLLATTTCVVAFLAADLLLSEPLFAVALVAAAAIPTSAGLAILRYHLFEIDRIISRTLTWAIISGLLLAVFAIGVIGLQAVLDDVTQGQTLAVAASTLVAFALFQPVRRRVQRVVDRRFDRARYDAERTAAAFAERLRDRIDLAGLSEDLRRVTDEAVRPVRVEVWLRTVTTADRRSTS